MKNFIILFAILIHLGVFSQVDNTMYGLYQILNPPSFQLASIDPLTGQITTIGSSILSNTVNATGSSLNPYNQTYSYQDEDSWLSLDLQNGTILSDVAVSLPNINGYFNNFRFNTSDSTMYGLFSQVVSDSITGSLTGDLRLATCDLSNGVVSLISPNSVAEGYTMSGNTIDPHLMVYYFESEGKFMGLDLYNGQIYSQPNITLSTVGSSFGDFAYSCADTSIYGLIMDNGVKALGKINPQTGVVTALPTTLNFNNYVMNSGGAIDPVNLIYYFQTLDSLSQISMVGLSLIDGSVVSQSTVSSNGNYFIMYRIQSDCYDAVPTRLNPTNGISEMDSVNLTIHPNPVQDLLYLSSQTQLGYIEIINTMGKAVQQIHTSENNVQIAVDKLDTGVYYIKVGTKSPTYTKLFIKN
jgi:hypothetical protein